MTLLCLLQLQAGVQRVVSNYYILHWLVCPEIFDFFIGVY